MKAVKYLIVVMVGLLASSMPAYADEDKSTMDKLQTALQQAGDKVEEIAKSLRDYDWKGTLQDTYYVGPAFVTGATFNGNQRATVVKPGEEIQCEISVNVNPDRAKDVKYQGLIFGFKDEAPQAVVKMNMSKEMAYKEKFTLKAPKESGIYQVRFRPIDAESKADPLKQWIDSEGNQPGMKATIGIIVVKS